MSKDLGTSILSSISFLKLLVLSLTFSAKLIFCLGLGLIKGYLTPKSLKLAEAIFISATLILNFSFICPSGVFPFFTSNSSLRFSISFTISISPLAINFLLNLSDISPV